MDSLPSWMADIQYLPEVWKRARGAERSFFNEALYFAFFGVFVGLFFP
jgi:hypothetical protein